MDIHSPYTYPMKKTTILIFSIAIMLNSQLFAQSNFNVSTNSFDGYIENNLSGNKSNDKSAKALNFGSVNCNPNTFFSVDAAGISEYTLNAGVVSTIGVVLPLSTYDVGIALCNNLDSGLFSPTFYSTYLHFQPYYFDGTDWSLSDAGSVAPSTLYNPGGNGEYLYYIEYDATLTPTDIVRYSAGTLTSVATLTASKQITVADLSVDDFGNVWFFTGPIYAGASDSLNVVSPNGQLLAQYYFPYNTVNAYGSFMMNDTLYIGLGAANPNSPNTLVPVTLSGTDAISHTPIPFVGGFSDLASCSPGNPRGLNDPERIVFSISPNPVSDHLTINRSNANSEECNVTIVDALGRKVYSLKSREQKIEMDASTFSNGIYFVQISSSTSSGNTQSAYQKFVVSH